MKTLITRALATVLFFALLTTNVWAYSFGVDFSSSNFNLLGGSGPVPYSPISGSFVYEAASITSSIDSLSSIDLTIGGHVYTLSEVGSEPLHGFTLVGGLDDGLTTIAHDNDDFWLFWDTDTLVPLNFTYTASNPGTGSWATYEFDRFSITPVTPVPEPSTFLLLGGGLAGLAFYARRRREE